MATTNNSWPPSSTSKGGPRLINALSRFEQAWTELIREVDTLNAKLEGNGSEIAHYNVVQADYGFLNNDVAMAARGEILAGLGTTHSLGNPSNTVGVAAETALKQMFTRLR